MKALVQRVKNASVVVGGKVAAQIDRGFLVFLCVLKDDDKKDVDYMVKKVINLRVFEDEAGKMNLSVKDVSGQLLVVSQFTLASDCRKGNRPSFDMACEPNRANELYQLFANATERAGVITKTGVFGAHMEVSLINDGPVTFMIESSK